MTHLSEVIIASNLEQALQWLSRPKSAPIAGGTDLVPGFHQQVRRFSSLRTLVDINHIPELRRIQIQKSGTSVGATVTFSEILQHPRLATAYPLLAQAAATLGSVQIRNRATLAGNFINNAPCADSVPPLLVYNAIVRIRSLQNSREIPLQEFLRAPYQTQLQPGELVIEIFLPAAPYHYQGEFYKLGRRHGVAISRITLAVLLQAEGSTLTDLRMAAGAVTPIGRRFYTLEEQYKGKKVSDREIKLLATDFGRAILEETGWRWSSPYKLPVTQQLVYHIFQKLIRGFKP